ncbi:Mitophagy receptor Atg43 [Abortiporus biennis]
MSADRIDDYLTNIQQTNFRFADEGSRFKSSSSNSHHEIHDNDDAVAEESTRARRRIPAVPDLRFEQSYLRGVRPYVHVERIGPGKTAKQDEKGKAITVQEEPSTRREVIKVDWTNLAWITTRDQVISPLLQGALWGVASHFLRPFLASFYQQVRGWWSRGSIYSPKGPKAEGQGVGWLRTWAEGVTASANMRPISK